MIEMRESRDMYRAAVECNHENGKDTGSGSCSTPMCMGWWSWDCPDCGLSLARCPCGSNGDVDINDLVAFDAWLAAHPVADTSGEGES